MNEIWNLNTLCRCCHLDGYFKDLNSSFETEKGVEIYEIVLKETLGIHILQPPMEASYTICDHCIRRLKDASQFKEQVLACEEKFKIYCINEQFLNSGVMKEITNIKTEMEYVENPDNYIDTGTINQDTEVDLKKKAITVKRKTLQKRSAKRIKYTERGCKFIEAHIAQIKSENDSTYACKTCGGDYQTKKDAYRHLRRDCKRFKHRYKCESCGNDFKHASDLKRHTKTNQNTSRSCRYCDKTFTCRNSLRLHENKHPKSNVYQCDICQKTLRNRTTLKRHIYRHSRPSSEVGLKKDRLCDFCGRAFDRYNLMTHIRAVHLKERPYSCPICGKTYKANKQVKYHMQTYHSSNPKLFNCDICAKTFACQQIFKLHILTHENKFVCRYCSANLDSKVNLNKHIKENHARIQNLSSPYTCHLCGKHFTTRYTLNRHKDLHDGFKRFACILCDIKFSQKCLLARHNRRKHDTNANIEKIKCAICKKLVSDIEKHMDTHSSETKKFCCDLCGRSYSENNALTRHKKQKHFGVSYDCDICGKKYVRRTGLETHKFKVHKIKNSKEIEPT